MVKSRVKVYYRCPNNPIVLYLNQLVRTTGLVP